MALTLERQQYETIHIGDSIVITVASRGRTKLNIQAPKEIRVMRGELVGDASHQKDRDCWQEGKAA